MPTNVTFEGWESPLIPLRAIGQDREGTVCGGAEGSRTLDLLNAIEALSQLSYSPTPSLNYSKAVLLAQLPPMDYNCRTMRLQTNISPLLGLALLRRNDL